MLNVTESAVQAVSEYFKTLDVRPIRIFITQMLVGAASETYRLSDMRYNKGIDNYLSVLDAQRSLFAAQQELVMLKLEKLSNQVRLYAVLGGGAE